MKFISLLALCCILIGYCPTQAWSQNLLDDSMDEDKLLDTPPADKAPALVLENIKTISHSKKIFILSNENLSYGSGDFISLLLQNKLVCRALVAKTNEEKLSGIKILKIYSLELWKQLETGKEVQVLRGDDSYFSSPKVAEKKKEKKDKKDMDKIQSEEDLYNSTKLDDSDDNSLEEKTKRLIKTDNLLALNVGMIDGIDETGAAIRYPHLNASWAYQVGENLWAEFTLGSNTVRDFPAVGIDTRMVSYSGRFKFTISAPFYSYFQPYIGYQVITVQSPGAETDAEFLLLNQLKKSRPIGGITLLKRIVPGWFARADLGVDLVSGGLSLEF